MNATSGEYEKRFWDLAEPLFEQAGVTRSTMMGFGCLRLDGDFFASFDHRRGHLVVKLDEPMVTALLESRRAEPFAPSGRRFREWASVAPARHEDWDALLHEALQRAALRRVATRPLHPQTGPTPP